MRSLMIGSGLIVSAIFILLTGYSHAATKEYKLDSGDILNIVLLEHKDMSRNVAVSVDGTISFPGVGTLVARGKTLRELEDRLRTLVAKTIVQPSLAIQILEYRPFFILGEVTEGGKYPYIANLNVLKAISLARGFRKGTGEELLFSKKMANIKAKQAIGNNITVLASLHIRLARILAEQTGESEFSFKAENALFSDLPVLDRMLTEEQFLLEKRILAYETQLAQVKETIVAREQEVESYLARSHSQVDLDKHIKKEIGEVRELKKKGLVSVQRLNRLVREQISIRGQALQNNSLLRQSQVSLSVSKEKLIALTFGRETDFAGEIRNLNDQITTLKASINGELEVIKHTETGLLNTPKSQQSGYIFSIHRDGLLLNQKIEFNTPILPGDTLIITRKPYVLDTARLYERP